MSVLADQRSEVEKLRKRLERERLARQETEQIAEQGTHALYQKQAELQLLRSIAVAANEAKSVNGVMQTAVDRICQYTGWPVGHALLLDQHGVLHTLGVWHLRDGQRYDTFRKVTEATTFAPGVGLPGRVLAHGKPAWISDVQQDDNFPRRKLAHDIGVHAGFAFPVLAGASTAAVLEFFADRPTEPDPALLELMAHIGTQLGLVIERTQAEDHIREQAALLDKARDAILVLDLQGHVRYWNHSAERLYGYAQAEALGQNFDQLLKQNGTGPEEEARRQCLVTGAWCGELHQVSKNGDNLVVESRWTLLREETGRPKGKLLINTDITARKKLESHLQRAQRLESLGTLAGGIAHDLNNVLTPIIMGFDLLRRKLTDPVGLRFLASMEDNARRGSDMIKQVLSFARGTDGTRQHLQLAPLISEVGKLLKQTLPRSVEIRLTVPKDLWMVLGDPTQLHQVIMNLCVNARDAMPQGGRLTLTTQNVVLDEHYARMNLAAFAGPYVSLKVEDTGSGIPPGIIDQIFDPFFTTKEIGRGTGLGLSNALGIVQSHGGFINVYSELGKGTCFTVYLPAAHGTVVEEGVPQQCQRLRGNGELILVVDDELGIRDITQITLEDAGYQVLTAEDGAAALAVYVEHRADIHVVLTDLMMPIMDGPALVRALRKLDPDVRIIAASGHSRAHAEEWQSGVRAFLPKPFTAEIVLQTLHEVLHEGESARTVI